MPVEGRDASDYDASVSYAGLGLFTHKATEGTSTRHKQYGARLAAARRAGVPVLGSYHVLRTPGSGGAGALAQQLSYWVAYQDAQTPWWRAWPHWIMQIDAERWSYDQVAPSTIKRFAELTVDAHLPAWVITYASHGQYGDTLAGIRTPLWNANYGSNTGAYPGDNSAGWRPYSGQTPTLLQYASRPYDKDRFRGSLAQLQALFEGDDLSADAERDISYLAPRVEALTHMLPKVRYGPESGQTVELVTTVQALANDIAAIKTAVAGLATAIAALPKDGISGDVPVTITGSGTAHLGS